MGVNKRLIGAGATGSASGITPSEHFGVMLYEGDGSSGHSINGGKFGAGAYFNNSNSSITLSNASSLFGTPAGQTISLWANFKSVTASSWNSTILVASNNGDPSWQITLFNGKLFGSYFISSSLYRQVRGSTSISTNTWYHFVIIFDSSDSNIVKLYVNGQAETLTIQGSAGTFTNNYISNPDNATTIGFRQRDGGSWYMDGKKDKERFFTKALSSSEVSTLNAET